MSKDAVIFIGIQATGKSTFYKERFFRSHVRINLDMLRTRHREELLFKACLAARQSLVIDNTNCTQADRRRYILPAKEAGFHVVGYYFKSSLEECLRRNAERPAEEVIPEGGLCAAHGRLELPAQAEGFDELYYVSIDPEHKIFLVSAWSGEDLTNKYHAVPPAAHTGRVHRREINQAARTILTALLSHVTCFV